MANQIISGNIENIALESVELDIDNTISDMITDDLRNNAFPHIDAVFGYTENTKLDFDSRQLIVQTKCNVDSHTSSLKSKVAYWEKFNYPTVGQGTGKHLVNNEITCAGSPKNAISGILTENIVTNDDNYIWISIENSCDCGKALRNGAWAIPPMIAENSITLTDQYVASVSGGIGSGGAPTTLLYEFDGISSYTDKAKIKITLSAIRFHVGFFVKLKKRVKNGDTWSWQSVHGWKWFKKFSSDNEYNKEFTLSLSDLVSNTRYRAIIYSATEYEKDGGKYYSSFDKKAKYIDFYTAPSPDDKPTFDDTKGVIVQSPIDTSKMQGFKISAHLDSSKKHKIKTIQYKVKFRINGQWTGNDATWHHPDDNASTYALIGTDIIKDGTKKDETFEVNLSDFASSILSKYGLSINSLPNTIMKVSVRVQSDQATKFMWSGWTTCRYNSWVGEEYNYTTADYASIVNTIDSIKTGDNFYLTYLNPSGETCKIEIFISGEDSPIISKVVEGSGISSSITKTLNEWNELYKLFKTPRVKTDNELIYNCIDLKVKITNIAKRSNTMYIREYDTTVSLNGNVLSAYVNASNIKKGRVYLSKSNGIKSAVTWVFKDGKWKRGKIS